jgi:hypothetical protein
VTQQPLATHPPLRVSAFKYARRFIARVYLVVGGVANLLGIYAFGESHHWWEFTFAVSSEMKEVFWMLAVGLGGPWAMMVGGIASAKFAELFTKDRAMTAIITARMVDVGFFFSIFHCAEMEFGIKIYPLYLSSAGFVKVVIIYLLMGVALGTVLPLVLHAIRRALAKN